VNSTAAEIWDLRISGFDFWFKYISSGKAENLYLYYNFLDILYLLNSGLFEILKLLFLLYFILGEKGNTIFTNECLLVPIVPPPPTTLSTTTILPITAVR
jgi:hypothetical protein